MKLDFHNRSHAAVPTKPLSKAPEQAYEGDGRQGNQDILAPANQKPGYSVLPP